MKRFEVKAPFSPSGDQPQAIDALVDGIESNERFQTLMGVTGSGKTFTMAQVIEKVQRPTLVISHNKTLAAQLFREFKEFFPKNAVEYFVSYYDYYQPEAYVPSRDLYIEKDSDINEEIERLRLSATMSLMERRDVIVVASVSCIYGLGNPTDFKNMRFTIEKGMVAAIEKIARNLVDLQYERNQDILERGKFRLKGDVLEIYPAYMDEAYRITFEFDEVAGIARIDPIDNSTKEDLDLCVIYPATHFAVPEHRMKGALELISAELETQEEMFRREEREVERQRLRSRTNYDLEMLEEMGICKGIENYSRHIAGRSAGEPPDVLLDYFPEEFVTFIDESHVSLGQIRGMYRGDQVRKASLVEYGFRLPSALDNRPLVYEEFEERVGQIVYVSATPGSEEIEKSTRIVEQLIRPTGLLDPEIEVRPTEGQIENLYTDIIERVKVNERVLITTLTKRMAEKLTDYLCALGVKTRYLHSEIDAFERVDIIRDLRLGVFDVLVGINLLREGLDIPEVSLIAILDADKVGFLRSTTSLIQTIGRAARNTSGKVLMYADKISTSMEEAISETNRRREKQMAYNTENGITPHSVKKAVQDILVRQSAEKQEAEKLNIETMKKSTNLLIPKQRNKLIKALENEMRERARNLEFEEAAVLRDEIEKLKKEIVT